MILGLTRVVMGEVVVVIAFISICGCYSGLCKYTSEPNPTLGT